MTTHLPFAFPIRVPDDMLVEFGKFTGLHWNDTLSMEPFVCEALRNYMKPAPAAQPQAATSSESGYQWKEVFLPEGTRLAAATATHGKLYGCAFQAAPNGCRPMSAGSRAKPR